ncbi:hypothetical protein Acsp02_53980 [Actinoplanes sp. NBRC 103695]|nr:hypothetical protein Acsp02_53980 [Actinoplanes sp. NBRC 103695]
MTDPLNRQNVYHWPKQIPVPTDCSPLSPMQSIIRDPSRGGYRPERLMWRGEPSPVPGGGGTGLTKPRSMPVLAPARCPPLLDARPARCPPPLDARPRSLPVALVPLKANTFMATRD